MVKFDWVTARNAYEAHYIISSGVPFTHIISNMDQSGRRLKRPVVIDTNILLTRLDQLPLLDHVADLYIPKAVVNELVYLNGKENLTYNVKSALSYLEKRRAQRDPRIGSCISQSESAVAISPVSQNGSKVTNDDKILHWALHLQRQSIIPVTCFTQDLILQTKAIACGINATGDVKSLLISTSSEPPSFQVAGPLDVQIVPIIIDETFLIHRLGLLKTLTEQSGSLQQNSFRFLIHIPWQVLANLDQLKISHESVDTKMKASRAVHYILDCARNRSPWIRIQHVEQSLDQWMAQFKQGNVFILSQEPDFKSFMGFPVINEEKLLAEYFSGTCIQKACQVLPAVTASSQPWYRKLNTTSPKKVSGLQRNTLKSNSGGIPKQKQFTKPAHALNKGHLLKNVRRLPRIHQPYLVRSALDLKISPLLCIL